MVFTPKFIDLVKNVTTVQGTGPVTLDQTVTGFTSFASACATGDQFYYAIQGIDKPAEREVGRGTMQADGTIARSPIGGAATNFTKGNKYIALVAAAEWLAQVDSAIKAPPAAAPGDKLLSELSGATIAAAVRVVRSAGYAQAGVGIADYVQDAAVNSAYVTANPRTAFLAADGRGFRLDPAQRLTVEMFGGVGDFTGNPATATDNYAAIIAAAEYGTSASNRYGLPIHFGGARYYAAQTIEPNAVFTLTGTSVGVQNGGSGGQGSEIVTPTNVTTIRVKCLTLGATAAPSGGNVNAGGSTLIGMTLAQVTKGSDLTAHGLDARGTPILENCIFRNIAGNAINIAAWTDAGGRYGNANLWRVINCHAYEVGGDGLRVTGADANAGISIGFNASPALGGCGIHDTSYFANGHYGVHLSGYGNGGVQYGGKNWQLLVSANTGTTPGTDGTVWEELGALASPTGSFPAWSAGTAYTPQLPFLVSNGSPVEGYNENGAVKGHAPASIARGTLATTMATSRLGNGNADTSSTGSLCSTIGIGMARSTGGSATHPLYAQIGTGEATIVGGKGGSNASAFRKSYLLKHVMNGTVLYWGYGLDGEGAGTDIDLGFFNNPYLMRITSPVTTETLGRSTTQPRSLVFRDSFLRDSTDSNNVRLRGMRASAPASGEWAQGDFVWNVNPTASGTLGWSCTTAGTPGTWTAVPVAGFAGSYSGTASFGDIKIGASASGKFLRLGGGTDPGATMGMALSFSGGTGYLDVNNPGAAYVMGPLTVRGSPITFNVDYTDRLTISASLASFTLPVRTNGALKSSSKASSADGVGYYTGAGGTVAQATDKATGVTLNAMCGQVTMNGAALAANTAVSFTLTNSMVLASDVVNASIASGASAGAYALTVDAVAAGSCRISLRNLSAGSLSEAVVINFAVMKAVAS